MDIGKNYDVHMRTLPKSLFSTTLMEDVDAYKDILLLRMEQHDGNYMTVLASAVRWATGLVF